MSIRSIAQLKSWFQKGLYPTQSAFWDLLDSFRHREEKIPISDVDTLRDELNDKFNRAEADQIIEMVENVSASFGEINNRIDYTEAGIGELYTEADLLREEQVAGDAATLLAANEGILAGDAATLEASKAYFDQKPHVTDAEKAEWNAKVSQTELTAGLSAKQDTLVSGANIKTVNGSSLIGAGDIPVSGGSEIITNPTSEQLNAGGMFIIDTKINPNLQFRIYDYLGDDFANWDYNPVKAVLFTNPSLTVSSKIGGTITVVYGYDTFNPDCGPTTLPGVISLENGNLYKFVVTQSAKTSPEGLPMLPATRRDLKAAVALRRPIVNPTISAQLVPGETFYVAGSNRPVCVRSYTGTTSASAYTLSLSISAYVTSIVRIEGSFSYGGGVIVPLMQPGVSSTGAYESSNISFILINPTGVLLVSFGPNNRGKVYNITVYYTE